jgi:hypothetical protein
MTHKDNELPEKIDEALDLIVVASVGKGDAFAITETVELAKDALLDLFTTTLQQREQEAVYGFHGYIMGKDIIRDEKDHAFNYARLHHAIDHYIETLSNTDKESI